MPLSPEWWSNGLTDPFRDNPDGAITASTLRTFSQHISDEGTRSGWIQYAPAAIVLDEVIAAPNPLPVTDDFTFIALGADEPTLSYSTGIWSWSAGNPASFTLANVGMVVVEAQVYGTATYENLPAGSKSVPVLVDGFAGAGYPIGANFDVVDGVIEFSAARRILLDTSLNGTAGIEVFVGLTTLVVGGTWGDVLAGDTLDVTSLNMLMTATPAAPAAV